MPSHAIVTTGAPVMMSDAAMAISLATIRAEYKRDHYDESNQCDSIQFDRRFDSIYAALFMPKAGLLIAVAVAVYASVATASAQTPAPSPAPPPTFTSSVTETVDVAVHAVTTEHV